MIIILVGCAGARLGGGSVRWRAVETEHFKLHTDLAQEKAEERANELERVLYAFQSSAFHTKGKLPLKLNVVMFASDAAFEEYAGRDVGGYILYDMLYEPWVVMPAPDADQPLRVLSHELTHHVTFAAMSHQPAWFSEGLATYFETARFDNYESRFVVGKPPLYLHEVLTRGLLVPPSELIGKGTFTTDDKSYASAWLLVHYLMNQRSEQFAVYQGNLAKGLGFTRAYEEAFQGLSLAQLDAEVDAYFRDGLYESVAFALPQSERAPMKSRTLSIADEHAIAGLLWEHCMDCKPEQRARASERYQLALAADPLQLQVRATQIQASNDVQAAQALTAAHPDQWLAWLVLGLAAHHAHSQELADRAAKRALELAPTQANAWMLSAVRHAAHGEREPARRAADNAQRLQRNSPSILATRGVLLSGFGECAALNDLLARAREQPELAIDAATRQRLEQSAQRCQR